LASVMVAAGLFLVSTSATAGAMKDVQLSHLEALAEHLYGTSDIDLLTTRNTNFVPAPAGFFIAVASEVSVESAATGTFEWQICTTFFEKTARGSDDFVVTKVSCVDL